MFSENEKISVRQLKRNQWLLLLNMGILLVPLYENEGSVTAGSLAILLLTVFVLWSIWVEAPAENSWLRLPGRIYFWIVGTMIARIFLKEHDGAIQRLVLCGPPTENKLAGI